jgi:hypothetical protein
MKARFCGSYGVGLILCSCGVVTLLAGCGGGHSNSASTPPASTSPAITSVTASSTPASAGTGATSQCTAAVTGTGSYSSTVTWSAGGVVGGNSTAGTITSGGVYTAPAAVPATNPVTVTATSTEDTTKSGSTPVTITASGGSGGGSASISNAVYYNDYNGASPSSVSGFSSSQNGMAIDGQGSAWFTAFSGSLSQFDALEITTTATTNCSSGCNVFDALKVGASDSEIAIDRSGDVFISNNRAPGGGLGQEL